MHSRFSKFAGLIWIVVVALLAHLLYSSLGFNPTDDGFTLAYARRILEGQIPHRDFIIIRPALSPMLHVPEVFVGGKYLYWLSRFVFFIQLAGIAWLGTAWINKAFKHTLGIGERSLLASVAFIFCCHSFPAMAWHTIDGLTLCVAGLWMNERQNRVAHIFGYLLLGSAMLCKQGFVFVAPAALILSGNWRTWPAVIGAGLPPVIYALVMLLAGAWRDAFQQLASHGGVLLSSVLSVANVRLFAWLTIGGLLGALGDTRSSWSRILPSKIKSVVHTSCLSATVVIQLVALWRGHVPMESHALLAVVAGVVGYESLFHFRFNESLIRAGAMLLILAWCLKLSIGYNSPAFASGLLLVFLILHSTYNMHSETIWVRMSAFIALSAFSVAGFHYTRTHHIYRDQTARDLQAPLGNVLPGGKLIYTNVRTYAFLADLKVATEKVSGAGKTFVILPEAAGYWAGADQSNPLPIDWTIAMELNTEALKERVLSAIRSERGKSQFIVQKIQAAPLAVGYFRMNADDAMFPIVAEVTARLRRVNGTRYFDIYE